MKFLKLTRFWKDSPILNPNLEVFYHGYSEFFVSHCLNILSNSQDSKPKNGGEILKSGARTKGVLEPRLSGLGLRRHKLGMVFDMRSGQME